MKERALDKYNKYTEDEAPETPLERLTFFLSLGLNGKDWLDVEPFLTAVRKEIEGYKRDALRYRMLRSNERFSVDEKCADGNWEPLHYYDLDCALDEEIGEEK